ncbi:MAG: STELLO glycosyltransferase family protein [bacterium]
MSDTKLLSVITTVQTPTPSMVKLVTKLNTSASTLIVIGDKKGPCSYDLPGVDFFPLERQHGFKLTGLLPENHYSRKNLGYLIAIEKGATCIYETDDDNAPAEGWKPRDRSILARKIHSRRWMNVYRFFSDGLIWPRGFPLDEIANPETFVHHVDETLQEIESPVQQGLANGSPDVDAVWRLVLDQDIQFQQKPSLVLLPGTWCPFNSQSTWWWPVAYPLLYLPSHCSFRMTDIWRSFIAQRCLWEIGHGVAFHAPEVDQDRNGHDLMRDFRDEVPGYINNNAIVDRLSALKLEPGAGNVSANLYTCYEAFVADGYIPDTELVLVRAFLDDLDSIS